MTQFSNTPFDAVRRAGNDLKASEADENWLVVLTDGEFDNVTKADVEKYYYDVASGPNTQVIMLAMGSHVSAIDADASRGVYFEHAATGSEIRGRLTRICNRIFQRNALPEVTPDNVRFGVPMSRLIVFAQGNDVKIGAAKSSDGTPFEASSNVHAAWSELAATNLPRPENVVVNKTLSGQIATFEGHFKPDAYKFDIAGADTVEIYYKPDVKIATYLFDDADVEVTKNAKLLNGTYRIEFGFIDAKDSSPVTDTALLGKIEYTASIVNTMTDDTANAVQVKSGDSITIKEGKIDVDVTARFLEYNTVNTKSTYQVYFANELVWSFDQKPTYSLVSDGFSNGDEPIILTVKMKDGNAVRELTQAEWDVMAAPTFKYTGRAQDKETSIGAFKVEKQTETGRFHVFPSLSENGPFMTTTGELPVAISGGFSRGDSTAAGTLKDQIVVRDDIGAFERLMHWLEENWHWLWKAIAGFILFCGYAFKKRLPKDIKKSPVIEAKAKSASVRNTSFKANYKKNPLQIFVPFRADTAVMSFPPSIDTEGIPRTFRLKAAGGKKIQITNSSAFAEKKNITLGSRSGTEIQKTDKRPFIIRTTESIVIRTKNYNYTCTLNK